MAERLTAATDERIAIFLGRFVDPYQHQGAEAQLRAILAASPANPAPSALTPQQVRWAINAAGIEVSKYDAGKVRDRLAMLAASPAALTDEAAMRVALRIMANLEDRNGLLDGVDDDTKADIADEIAVTIRAASPADQVGWQLIEEAPKDREVWAFNGEQGRMQWSEGSADNGEGWALWVWCDPLLSDADPEPEQPTHFMPLPADPVAAMSTSREGK